VYLKVDVGRKWMLGGGGYWEEVDVGRERGAGLATEGCKGRENANVDNFEQK
jgi:hypothetical protein